MPPIHTMLPQFYFYVSESLFEQKHCAATIRSSLLRYNLAAFEKPWHQRCPYRATRKSAKPGLLGSHDGVMNLP